MPFFVSHNSIVRKIWGKSDTILFIFAGAAAEFALNKAVDWLYFTGQLPADPLGRLFSTVTYAKKIVFLPQKEAEVAIDQIAAIHEQVEKARAAKIPQWAYRDVLYMLIGYSITSYEVLERRLSAAEKEEVYDVFFRVGERMKIARLPHSYEEWLQDRQRHLENDLQKSKYSTDLYLQYRKHLGPVRFWLLLRVQELVCPQRVKELLDLKAHAAIPPALLAYKFSRLLQIDEFIKTMFLPSEYRQEIKALDRS